MRGPLQSVRDRWSRLRRRLDGLTRSDVLFADEPARLVVAVAYPPPGGRVKIKYRRELELDAEAKLKVFGMNLGRGGAVSLGSAFEFIADVEPLRFVLGLRASATRHSNETGDRSLVSLDVTSPDGARWELLPVDEPVPAYNPVLPDAVNRRWPQGNHVIVTFCADPFLRSVVRVAACPFELQRPPIAGAPRQLAKRLPHFRRFARVERDATAQLLGVYSGDACATRFGGRDEEIVSKIAMPRHPLGLRRSGGASRARIAPTLRH